jgi:UDP-N-acetyl-2-amino-2-deoxyglucuronate dehydrogenase
MAHCFRLAIVGCGRISGAHAAAAAAAPSIELAALVDPVAERARSLAERVGASPLIATSIRELHGRVDGVVIATPNHTHADLACECLAAGFHTLIEKPLAATVADGERILRVASETQRVVAVGYVTRFRDNVRFMADLLRRGYFGEVRRFAYQFGSRGGWAPLSAYNLDRRLTGGGVLVVTGTHFIDRMLDWFGYPDEVALSDDSLGGPEATAVATFRFRRGRGTPLSGVARFSKSVALQGGVVLDTERGMVVLPDRPDASIVVRPQEAPDIETVVRPRLEGPPLARPTEFGRQLEDFVRACRDGGGPAVSGEQGMLSLRLIEALYAHRRPLPADWYRTPMQEIPA